MPVSRDCLVAKANELLSGSNSDLELLQLSGLAESNTVFSVATINDLPDASLNKGRFIFVSDIGAYRYSDGVEWTNDYDSTAITSLYAWGCNTLGSIGDGTTITRSSPVQEVSNSTDWCQVSAGGYHSLALKTTGTLWAWGVNFSGRLGDGTTTIRSSLVQEVSSSTDWCQVSAGGYNSLALKTNNTLWVWGDNGFGQLGVGTTNPNSSPVQEITSSTNWHQVSAGGFLSTALKTSGTLWSWGQNNFGQLADGTTISRSSPVQEVTSSTDWCQVSGSNSHSLALKTSGTLWSWGANGGRLGDGTTINRCSPVQEITSSTNWCQINSGNFSFSLALKNSGTLWGWGDNGRGQLGDQTTIQRSSPVQEVSSSTDWCHFDGGGEHSLALKTSGTLWVWGFNDVGQLGNGTVVDISSPVQEFTSSINWAKVSGGNGHSLALRVEKGFI